MLRYFLPLRVLIVLGALSAFGPLSMDLYLPALPDLAKDLQTSASMAQLTMSACMVGLGVGQLLVGPLSDRFGRRGPLLIGVGVYGLTSLACALAPSVGVLIALRVAQGLAGGAGIVIARAIVRDLCAGDAVAKVFSLLMLVNGAAPILAPVLGAQLLRVGPWESTFYALTVVGCLLLASSAAGLSETLPPARRSTGGLGSAGRAIAAAIRDRQFVAATAVLALGSAMLFCYISMSSFVFQDHFGLTAQQFSLVFAGNSVGLIAMGPLGARLIDQFGVTATLTAGLVVSVVGSLTLVALALAEAALAPFLVVQFLALSTVGLIMPGATALGLADQGERAGTASGLMGMVQFALGAVVAPVASAAGVSPITMSVSMAISAAIAAAIHLRVLRPGSTGRQDAAAEAVVEPVAAPPA